jgi:hypothetical protein
MGLRRQPGPFGELSAFAATCLGQSHGTSLGEQLFPAESAIVETPSAPHLGIWGLFLIPFVKTPIQVYE